MSVNIDAAKAKLEQRNADLQNIIRRTKIDPSYAYDQPALLDHKMEHIAQNCESVLDFGRSSRHRFAMLKEGQAETADINQYDGYPDHFVDICDAETFPDKKFDAIICNAVIEHVYEPSHAVKNMYDALNSGGVCLCYAPFIFKYHAPDDLHFQDYYRYSKDGLAYLFRDFQDVTLYPVRGRASTAFNFMFASWKGRVEKRMPKINPMIDKILRGYQDPTQTSGYSIWAVKK